ncbi:hypothetical protein [Puniceicoccus vermicola]|uniref:Verru_Chthon cassette protein A n=1 Tax=Puniceicoccus vermicola TaxID=388746 RepID=A0A7X1E554_9BACT|nr:hypothetical protein [Puniceicoccus vermicola]MBC2602688.1 hypothetical protein [Puniceicoccus vermicola]
MRSPHLTQPQPQTTSLGVPMDSGFALIISISLMAFVLLILIAIATLTRIEAQHSNHQLGRLKAQQNALLSFNIALGELQKQTGPDTRITASSSLLDTDPSTPEVDGQNHNHWTGVWDESGNLLTWLISGNTGLDPEDPDFTTPDSVLPVSVLLTDDDSVTAPLQSISPNNGYAFWVSDEGIKAKFSSAGSETAGDLLLSSQKAEITLMSNLGWIESFSRAELQQAQYVNELAQRANDPTELTALRDRYHDLTARSYGLLTDTRNGGLKKDLTLALYDNSFMPTGQIFDPIGGVQLDSDPGGPLWSQLQNWATTTTNLLGQLPVQRQSQTQVGFHPVITQVQLYVLPRYDPTPNADGEYTVYLEFLPAVTLWNPYSVTLEETDYRLDFGQTFYQTNSSTEHIHHYDQYLGSWDIRINGARDDVKIPGSARLSLNLSNVQLMPGEAVCFSPPNGNTELPVFTRLARPKSGESELTPGFRPSASYHIPTGNTFTSASSGFTPADFELIPSRSFSNSVRLVRRDNESVLFEAFYLAGYASNAAAPSMMQPMGGPIASMEGSVGMKSIHNFVESGSDRSVKWTANYNPRASANGSNPIFYHNFRNNSDVVESKINNPSFESYVTLDGQDQSFGLPISGSRAGTGFSVNPVFNERSILFSSPPNRAELQSIGQLMDAPLYYSAPIVTSETDLNRIQNLETKYRIKWGRFDNLIPAYAIGNSLADPNIQSDQTFTRWTDYPPPSSQYFNTTYTNIKGMHYDYSYWLNEALWDPFFFSSLSSTTSRHPSNQRLVPLNESDTSALTSETAASNFLLDGAFNINSTSEEAWRAILAYSYGQTIEPDQEEGAPYLRIYDSPGEAFALSDDEYETASYHGYRTLNSSQIKNLAHQIVQEIKWRGPFTSLADFINRDPDRDAPNTLGTDAFRLKGPLAAALASADSISTAEANHLGINRANAQINTSLQSASIKTQARTENGFNGDAQKGWRSEGIPGWITQADLLARLGSTLTPRSDTFTIHLYGENNNVFEDEKSIARAEATVQRLPPYLKSTDPESSLPSTLTDSVNRIFGRGYKVVSFRWLN